MPEVKGQDNDLWQLYSWPILSILCLQPWTATISRCVVTLSLWHESSSLMGDYWVLILFWHDMTARGVVCEQCVEFRAPWSHLLSAPPGVQWGGWRCPPPALNLVRSQLQPPVDTHRAVTCEQDCREYQHEWWFKCVVTFVLIHLSHVVLLCENTASHLKNGPI